MTPARDPKTPTLLQRFARNETAATSVEYSLIGVVMAIVLLAALSPMRDQLVSAFTMVAATFQTLLG